jgi:transposase
MGTAYSQDLRDRVMAARDDGLTTVRVARMFRVSSSWVRRVMQRRREHGETAPRPRGGVTVVKIDLERLRALVEARPDATIRELHERLGVECNESAVGMALKRLGLTFKKSRSMRRSRIAPMSPSAAPTGRKANPTLTRNA